MSTECSCRVETARATNGPVYGRAVKVEPAGS